MECLNCSKILVRHQKKFCSRSCAVSVNNKGLCRNGTKRGKCVMCQKSLSGTSGKKYCSGACQNAYQREQKVLIGAACIQSLKRYIIEQNGKQCSICKSTQWMNKEIPLVLDHIDGNPENNSLSNLRLVCGNCDMQLPTYKSKNRGNGRASRRKRYADGLSY